MATTIKIQVDVRLAVKKDLLIAKHLLRLGQPYYVFSEKTKRITGVFTIDAYTNSVKLEELFLAKKIYVPAPDWDDMLHYQLQQTDLKEFNKYGHQLYKTNTPPRNSSE